MHHTYPTMHHFVTEMCTHVHISVTKWCIVGYGIGALWDLWDGYIKQPLHMHVNVYIHTYLYFHIPRYIDVYKKHFSAHHFSKCLHHVHFVNKFTALWFLVPRPSILQGHWLNPQLHPPFPYIDKSLRNTDDSASTKWHIRGYWPPAFQHHRGAHLYKFLILFSYKWLK